MADGGQWAAMSADERGDTVRAMRADGLSFGAIAAALGASRSAIAGFCDRNAVGGAGPHSPARPRRLRPGGWRPEEVAELRRLVAAGATMAAMTKALGRSSNAVRNKMVALDLRGANTDGTQRWTAEEDAALRRGLAAGWRLGAIASQVGRTEVAVRRRAESLGLDLPNRLDGGGAVPAVRAAREDRFEADKGPKLPAKPVRPDRLALPTDLPADAAPTPFVDVRPGQCRFMGGGPRDTVCCGAPVAEPGASWCLHHLEIVGGELAAQRVRRRQRLAQRRAA